MQNRSGSSIKSNSRLETIGMIILLPGVIWLAHFWHSGSFGLYEDDITIIPTAIQTRLPDLLKYLGNYIIHLYGHGRPLSDVFVELFSNLSFHIAGLQGLYYAGFAVLAINAILFYLLLKRVSSPAFAITGALAYCLFGADTTEPWVIGSLGLHPSITFLLLASHAYLSGKRVLSYFLILGTIFCYETAYLPFLAIPLFEAVWDRAWFKRLLRHAVIVIVIMGLVIFLRSFSSEARVSGLGIKDLLTVPFTHSIIGPIVTMGTYLYRPLQALRAINLEMALAMIGSFALFGMVLSRLRWDSLSPEENLWGFIKKHTAKDWLLDLRKWSWPTGLPDALKPLARLALCGLVMLILAYPLTFTIRPYAITGRDTRVHFAAVVGATILLTSVIAFLFYLAQSVNLKRGLILGCAAFLALMVGFGFVVQKDYSQAWADQRAFWTAVLPQIQDMTNGTVILADPKGLGNARQAGGNTWNMPRVLNQIYTFPVDWKTPPRVFRLEPGWDKHLVNDQGLFQLDVITTMAPPSLYTTAKSTDTIVFDTTGGKLTRQTGPLILNGKPYPLKPVGAQSTMGFKKGFLYDYLIDSSQK